MDLISRIKELCKERRITVAQLEQECGLGKKTIANWGKSSPSVDKLSKIADYFGVSIDFLLDREEPETDSFDEIRDELERLRMDPDLRVLLSAGAGLTREDLEMVIAMAKRMRGE